MIVGLMLLVRWARLEVLCNLVGNWGRGVVVLVRLLEEVVDGKCKKKQTNLKRIFLTKDWEKQEIMRTKERMVLSFHSFLTNMNVYNSYNCMSMSIVDIYRCMNMNNIKWAKHDNANNYFFGLCLLNLIQHNLQKHYINLNQYKAFEK